jgi:superfamily II DNA or RNA helicase
LQNGVVLRDVDAEIADAHAQLAELDQLREVVTQRLADLDRVRASSGVVRQAVGGAQLSAASKVELFRDLFRGRDDVFAVRWENRAKGRSGYSPRCGNEWKPGVCHKPKARCGSCTNQAFASLGDRELLAHLQGRVVVGIYPLLLDDTCRLLAIDLDGTSWRTDARAIRETCRSLGLEPTIERSRSGNGAHVWVFFANSVAATDARRLGFCILTETMARGATLSVASYDRLFPSQDVLPRGGFGNLIALPLQREGRQLGNTEFLDEALEPHRDQWSFLASVPKIAPGRLAELIADSGADSVLAVRTATERPELPWRPSRTLADRLRGSPMPDRVAATLAERLYIDRTRLPPALVDATRRLATFPNPMFMELQGMRMSVARTPRVIACFEELGQHLALPRGCLDDLRALLAEFDIAIDLDDQRIDGEPLAIDFVGNLNASQRQAADAMLAHEAGVLCAPPGWGKTVLATSLIASRGLSTLVLVHRKPLVEQWVERLSEFLGIPSKTIGRIGGGRRRATGKIDVAMVQTLARGETDDYARRYGHIVIDECHHVAAVSIERVLAAIPARYITGLTATPYRRDGHQPIIGMQCGAIRHVVDAAATQQHHALDLRVVRRDTSFNPDVLPRDSSIQEIYSALAADDDRLELVLSDARRLLSEGRTPMILTERHEHLDRLACLLDGDVPNLVVLHGGVQEKARRAALQHLSDLPCHEPRLVLATGRYIGEGFDDPRLDTLLLTMPIAWKGTVVQYAGRLHRAHPAKRDALVYDYVDDAVPVLRRMYAKRLRAYKKMGYVSNESDLTLDARQAA